MAMIQGSLTIHRLLAAMSKINASDLHIKVGVPPAFRIGGILKTIDAVEKDKRAALDAKRRPASSPTETPSGEHLPL
jgi:Tfp pilus assembly pilus retraction ATPase PilT